MIKKICSVCKKSFNVHNYREKTARYCSQKCMGSDKNANWSKSRFKNEHKGWNKGQDSRIEKRCKICNKLFKTYHNRVKYCSYKCYWNSKEYRGVRSNNWRGGKSFEPYSLEWTRELKEIIRQRDNYICQLCRKKQGKRAFDIHHIDYDKKNCNEKNLITFCHSCHMKTNTNREYWIEYFKKITNK